MRLHRLLAVAFTAGLWACSPMATEAGKQHERRAAATPSRHPQSGLEMVPLTIASARGRHAFRVEVARTPADQTRGLMFRTAMGADEGMIFPNDTPQFRSFWMKNTVIPLDIIFIGQDRRIVNIAANTTPYSESSVPSKAPVVAVLELNGGRTAQLGIKPGDLVEW